MQQIDSEDHEAKHSLNDDTPGENGRESAASAGNVVRNDRRLHTELGERKKKNSIKPKVWRVVETHGINDEVVWELGGGNSKKPNPVPLGDQPVGDPSVLHRIASNLH